jgi:hypothetical protein
MKKNTVLLLVFVALLASSGIVLFRGFGSQTLSVMVPSENSNNDEVMNSQVNSVKEKITKAIGKIDTGGSLDALIESQQFKDLREQVHIENVTTDIETLLTDGVLGRNNPFIPPNLDATTTEGMKAPSN